MPQARIEKLVQGGQGLARVGEKVVFIWGALPGEEVEYRVLKNKPRYSEGVATKILAASPARVSPRDGHYLSCSPWQTLAIAEEERWKVLIAEETYKKIGGFAFDNVSIVSSPEEYGYRRKMEFGFATNTAGQLSLAVRERDSERLVAIEQCALARPEIMAAALSILESLRIANSAPASLSGLIFRMSEAGQVIARLIVKNSAVRVPEFKLEAGLIGLEVVVEYRERTPLATYGQMQCDVQLGGITLTSGIDSFFQINVPLFVLAVRDIMAHVRPGSVVYDYYGGVGAIGLAATKVASRVTIVEVNQAAAAYAAQNIEQNKVKNAEVKCCSAAAAQSLIERGSTVIVDPPRTGLEPEMLERLVEVRPERIIYLSCDIATQARDLKRLVSGYTVASARLYNFFPHTPHTEALVVLNRS